MTAPVETIRTEVFGLPAEKGAAPVNWAAVTVPAGDPWWQTHLIPIGWGKTLKEGRDDAL